MSSRKRLFAGLLLGVLLLLLAVAALWFVLRGRGRSIEAPDEPRAEAAVETVILGLAPMSESVVVADAPLFLQLDLRAHTVSGNTPPPDRVYGSEAEPWWAGIRVILDPGTREEQRLAFDVLRPGDPVRIDLSGESAYLAVAVAPDTLTGGAHTLVTRFEWAGEIVARSNEIDLDVGPAALSRIEKSLLFARYYLELEQPEKVIESLDGISDQDSTEPDVYGLRGEALEMLGEIQGALESYNRAIELIALEPEEPTEPPTYYLRRRQELMGNRSRRRQP